MPSTSDEPMTQLMLASSDHGIESGLKNITALLDQQFHECDTVGCHTKFSPFPLQLTSNTDSLLIHIIIHVLCCVTDYIRP